MTRRLRARPLDLVRALPAWAWLAGLVVSSIALRYAFARRMPAPWIMVDELVYSELAKSFASSGEFVIRGEPAGIYGFVYPVLISPAYRLFDAVPDAYAAAKAINSVLMSLTAVPAYLLARRVLSPASSLLAALLTVAVPSTLYAGTLMTENAFYPLFVCVALALVTTLERPTAGRQLLLLAVCALAFLTRAQAVAILPAVVTAPVLLLWLQRRPLRSLAPYRVLYGVLGAGIAAGLAVQLVRGRSPLSLLGAYEAAGKQSYAPGAVARWLLYHLAELDLYLAVVPFAAFVLVVAVSRGLSAREQAFVAAACALVAWLAVEVAAFASLPTVQRVEERNLFYVAPLFFVALLLWLELGLPRPPRATALAALAAAALPGTLPYHELIGVATRSDTLMLLPWWWLQDNVITLAEVSAVAVLVSAALAAAFLLVPVRYAFALPALVLVYFTLTLPTIENARHGVRMASLGALFQGITTGERDWIDSTVGDTQVAYLWSGSEEPFALWQNEFFNRSIGPVYDVGTGLPGGLPTTQLTPDARTGVLHDPGGRPARARYALAHESLPLAGTPVRRDRPRGLTLIRVDGPLRWTASVRGLYPDQWSGASMRYTRYRCREGSLVAALESDPKLVRSRQQVVARVDGRRVASATVSPRRPRASLRVPLRADRFDRCTVSFSIAPTAVPALTRGGSEDTRALGVHFRTLRYRPAAP